MVPNFICPRMGSDNVKLRSASHVDLTIHSFVSSFALSVISVAMGVHERLGALVDSLACCALAWEQSVSSAFPRSNVFLST